MDKKKKTIPRELNGRQIRHLRGLGHHLSPTVMLGKEGITANLLKSTEEILTARELIKAKVLDTYPDDRKAAAAALAVQTGATVVQILGRTFLLYRENPDRKTDERLVLPK